MIINHQLYIWWFPEIGLPPNHPYQWLVGGFNPSEKYESHLGLFFPIYGKIKAMFQTTNQNYTLGIIYLV